MILSLLCFLLVPMIHQLEVTYNDTTQKLMLKRTFYNIIKSNIPTERQTISKYEISNHKDQICIQDIQSDQKYCHSK